MSEFMEKWATKTFWNVGIMAVIAAMSLLLAFPLKWTWNYVMPYIFGLPVITWGHAWCLNFVFTMLLSRISSHDKD